MGCKKNIFIKLKQIPSEIQGILMGYVVGRENEKI